MDWDEQERRALEILKDPGAEEQQWLDACNEIGSRKTVPYPALSKILDWPIAVVASFCSGIASIVGGMILGCAIVVGAYVFSGMIWPGFGQVLSPLFFIIGISMILGFILGLCRRTPAKHEGYRSGLITPIFAATVSANIFCLGGLLSTMGTWAYNIPILSLFMTLAAFKVGSNMLNQLLTEQQRGQRPINSERSLVSGAAHKAISLAKSSIESDSQKSETVSDQLRVDPEKLHLSSEMLHIEREKMKIEREKLELEREKLQIEMERVKRNTKRPRPDKEKRD